MNRIQPNITESDVVIILKDLLNKNGWYDSIDLNDSLERIKSPLVTYDKNGVRKLKRSIAQTLKQSFNLEFDNSDKCWYKR